MSLGNKKPSSSLLERLIDVMPYGIIIANNCSEFILHNTVAKQFFDSELNATIETRWEGEYGLYSLDKSVKYSNEETPAQRALKGNIVKSEKFFVRSKVLPDGFYIKVSSYPIHDVRDSKLIEAAVVIFEDITEEQTFYDSVIANFEEMEKYLREVLKVDYPPKKQTNESEQY